MSDDQPQYAADNALLDSIGAITITGPDGTYRYVPAGEYLRVVAEIERWKRIAHLVNAIDSNGGDVRAFLRRSGLTEEDANAMNEVIAQLGPDRV